MWDIQTGECHHTLKLKGQADCVSFSPKSPEHFITVSSNKVNQWNISGHETGPTYNGSFIAFSSVCSQFALCDKNVVTVQNSDSGAITVRFSLPVNGHAKCCCFSPNGRLIAVACNTIAHVWEIVNSAPHLVATFVGHIDNITSLVFSSSSSLISASQDGLVRFWQIGAPPTDLVSTDLNSAISTLASIEFVSLQAKEGIAISGDSNGVVKIWDLTTGLCKESLQTPARKTFWGDAQLIDGRVLFFWGLRGGIHIWDSEKGEFPQELHSNYSLGLRISGDGSKVFNVDQDDSVTRIQAWSIWTWKPVGKVELMNGERYYLESFHADCSKVWVQSNDLTIKGWDFGNSGSSPILLSNSSSERPYLDFIDGASWENGPSFVKNTVTGKEVFRLSGKYAEPWRVQWDGQYLVSGYRDGEVLILCFKNLCYQ